MRIFTGGFSSFPVCYAAIVFQTRYCPAKVDSDTIMMQFLLRMISDSDKMMPLRACNKDYRQTSQAIRFGEVT